MNKFIKTVLKTLTEHKTDIKFGIGIAGLVSASVLTGIETVKAVKKVEKYKETHDEVTKKDIIKLVWQNYISPVALTGASVGLTLSARKDLITVNAGLAAAATFYETSLKDVEDAIKDVSDNTKQEIVDKIAEKKLEKAENPTVVKEVFIDSEAKVLCYDPISSRYFHSRKETIREKVNDLNYRMTSGRDFSISLNEYFEEVGDGELEPTDVGDQVGWNATDGLIDLYFSTKTTETGVPCLVVGFYNLPKYDFDQCTY